jgi:hypothetical protein
MTLLRDMAEALRLRREPHFLLSCGCNVIIKGEQPEIGHCPRCFEPVIHVRLPKCLGCGEGIAGYDIKRDEHGNPFCFDCWGKG